MEYSKIKDEIMDAPATYLPGLLVAVVRATLAKKVLKPGGAARIAQEVEDEATGQPEDVASGSTPATCSASGPRICASCGAWPAQMTPNGLRCSLCECRDYCAANPVPLPSDPQMLKDLASIGVPGAADKLQLTPNDEASNVPPTT